MNAAATYRTTSGFRRVAAGVGLYIGNLALAVSQALSAIIGRDPRLSLTQTLAMQARLDCKLCRHICAWLDRIDPGHCADSVANWSGERTWSEYDRSLWR